jgi:hypothetical protein
MLERDADDPLIERFCFIFRDDQTERRPIDRIPDKRQQNQSNPPMLEKSDPTILSARKPARVAKS